MPEAKSSRSTSAVRSPRDGRVEGDTGAGDAAADHQDVEGFVSPIDRACLLVETVSGGGIDVILETGVELSRCLGLGTE